MVFMPTTVLSLLSEKLSVCRLTPQDPFPGWALSSRIYSITKTEDELSVVCESHLVPPGVLTEKGWIVYKVHGPLDFGLTGILASIANPLADAKVSLFALSTYDTDYVLVKEGNKARSLEALKKAGFQIQEG